MQTAQILDALFDALADTSHLRRHCHCSGPMPESRCVPCEVAEESNDVLERHREWRAQGAALVPLLAHAARCLEAITSNHTDCSDCSRMEAAAKDGQHDARSWEESRK